MSPTSGGPLQNYALSLLGASATSSGYGTYAGYNSVAGGAIDNSTGTDSTPPTTFWSDEGCQTTRTTVGSPSWLLVDLGQEIEVRRLSVTLSIANMNFKLLVASASATGPFSEVAASLCTTGCVQDSYPPNPFLPFDVVPAVSARYVKMEITWSSRSRLDVNGGVAYACGANNCCRWGTTVNELAVYGPALSSPTTTTSPPTFSPTTNASPTGPSLLLFAITDATQCAERLRYGTARLTEASSAYFSTVDRNVKHQDFTQILAPYGNPSDTANNMVIHWHFADEKTLKDRFVAAVAGGEPCTWEIHYGGSTYAKTGTWWYSDRAGNMASKFAASGSSYSGFSGDDGAWGGATGSVNGDYTSRPRDFFGHANWQGGDAQCGLMYANGVVAGGTSTHNGLKNFMYLTQGPTSSPTSTRSPTTSPTAGPTSSPTSTRSPTTSPTAGPVPGYYPSGVQLDVPESTITAGGWMLCYDRPYNHQTTAADLTLCSSLGTFVLMGAKSSSGASNLTLLAAGATANVLATTSSMNIADLENGAYWYNYPGKSVGFAESSQISLSFADVSNTGYPECSQRLSWHNDGGWQSGGWRAGCTTGLFDNTGGYTWRKLIYTASATAGLTTSSPTTSPPTTSPTTLSPTTSSPTTVSPTNSPTSAPPTSAPTSTRSPTISPTTTSPTITRSPTTYTASPTRRVPAGYYPSGVQLDVPETTITAGGWTICYDQPYDHQTTAADLNRCSSLGTFVLMGAKSSSEASNLTMLAAGATANALATTSLMNVAFFENGAYWYNSLGKSVGFAESSQIDLGMYTGYDMYNMMYPGCSQRLSWHLFEPSGGYYYARAGCTFHDGTTASTTWRKLIYTSTSGYTSSPTSTRSPTSSPTTTSPATAAPTDSPTTKSPTSSPTTSSPTITRSPTSSPTGWVPGYYPSGVQLDVPETNITAGGWTICYDQPYYHQTTAADLTQCSSRGTFVLMGAKGWSGASNLFMLAAGATANALATTSSLYVADLENGAYWYNYPGDSVGFAESSQIDISGSRNYDMYYTGNPGCSQRLSWPLHLSETYGDWYTTRAGCNYRSYDGSGTTMGSQWRKIIYTSTGPTSSPTTTRSPTTLARLAVASGPCTVVGGCFRSPNYPDAYANNQMCTIDVLQDVTLRVVAFSTESSYDSLTVNGVDYSGLDNGPDGVNARAGTSITWASDVVVVDTGFEICATATSAPTISPTTTSPTTAGLTSSPTTTRSPTITIAAGKFVGQPCVYGSNTGFPTPTNATSCADAGAVRAQHFSSKHAPACYYPNATLTLMDETHLHGVRCYSPTLGYGSCDNGMHTFTTAVNYCHSLETQGVSDYRLPFTNNEQGEMCANGCGLDSTMLWYGDSPTMSPNTSLTAAPTASAPTAVTSSPTTTPTTPTTAPTTSSNTTTQTMVTYSVITYPSVDISMFANSAFATHFRREYIRSIASAARVAVDKVTIVSITDRHHAESGLEDNSTVTAGITVVSSSVRFPATNASNLRATAFAALLNADPSRVFTRSVFGDNVSASAAATTVDDPNASLPSPPPPARTPTAQNGSNNDDSLHELWLKHLASHHDKPYLRNNLRKSKTEYVTKSKQVNTQVSRTKHVDYYAPLRG